MFEEDYLSASSEEVEKRMKKRGVIRNTAKAIICLETKEEFRSARDVKGIGTSGITSCCLFHSGKITKLKERVFTAGGFHWLYKEDYASFPEDKIQKILNSTKETCKTCLKERKITRKTKEVININSNSVYASVKEASVQTGYNADSIREACLNKPHTLFGEIWLYGDEYSRLSKDDINKMLSNLNKNSFKKIICLETGEVFKGATEACKRYVSTQPACIGTCCSGSDPSRLTAGGVHWMYYNDYLKATPEEIEAKLKTRQGQKASKAVIKLETLEVYASVKAASAATGLSEKTIRYSCTGERKTTPKNGHWMFKEEYDKLTPEEIEKRLKVKRKGHNRKKVLCIETGVIYGCLEEATSAVGGCPHSSAISKCCKNPETTYKCYHWRYFEKEEVA